jgi:hypothetical protein
MSINQQASKIDYFIYSKVEEYNRALVYEGAIVDVIRWFKRYEFRKGASSHATKGKGSGITLANVGRLSAW